MTIYEAKQNCIQQLKAIYPTSEAENITRILLEKITNLPSVYLHLNKQALLTNEQKITYTNYLQRLLQHEPIQYILQEAWFYKYTFFVNSSVLVPRPETEELVEKVIAEIKNKNQKVQVLDIGTGSGCIAISIKKETGNLSTITAIDISEAALQTANRNTDFHKAEIQFECINFLNAAERNKLSTFDFIVSNPPYISKSEQAEIRQNVLQYEPYLALFPEGKNPLVFYEAIADFAKNHLHQNGQIWMEINEILGTETQDIFLKKGFATQLFKDLQGKERILQANL